MRAGRLVGGSLKGETEKFKTKQYPGIFKS